MRDNTAKDIALSKTERVELRLAIERLRRSDYDCWLWLGGTTAYGLIRVGGRIFRAHRVSYAVFNGAIPHGLHVLHLCDQSRCVNPAHLYLGNNDDNVRDRLMSKKPSSNIGENNGRCKITEQVAIAVIRALKAEQTSQEILQIDERLTGAIISSIKSGSAWRAFSEREGLTIPSKRIVIRRSATRDRPIHQDDIDAFWARVDRSVTCWFWRGALVDGYGHYYWRGRSDPAHVFAFRLARGRWPAPELDLAHLCHERACVHPKHLAELARRDHISLDAASGHYIGSPGVAHNTKINAQQVLELRKRAADGETNASLAVVFSLTEEAIGDIIWGRTWANVGGPIRTTGVVRSGERAGRAKLTDAQVVTLRTDAYAGVSARILAESFGISQRQVYSILNGTSRGGAPVQRPMNAKQKIAVLREKIFSRRDAGERASIIARTLSISEQAVWKQLRRRKRQRASSLAAVDLRKNRPAPGGDDEAGLIDIAFTHLRATGFPYPTWDDDLIRTEFETLCRTPSCLQENRLTQSVVGLSLLNAFHPQMYHVRCLEKPSPVEIFRSDELLRGALKWRIRQGDNLNPNRVRAAICAETQSAGNFRPTVAKAIYEFLKPALIVDPCAGWGGRMLGAMSLGIPYIGIDPSTAAINGNRALLAEMNRIHARSFNVVLVQACAEDTLGHGRWAPDLIFTSPPYFNTERYSEEPTQSFNRYSSLQVWYDGFMAPLITGAFVDLLPGGHLVLNVAADLISFVTDFAVRSGFQLVRVLDLLLSRRPMQKARGTFKHESVFVFRKPVLHVADTTPLHGNILDARSHPAG